MASLSHDEIVKIVQNMLDDSGSTTKQDISHFVNIAKRDVAQARDWPELMVRDFVVLGAPYSTGTAALTVNSASVTGTGTAWDSQTPVIDIQYKFALGYANPYYRLSAVPSSDTALTLADNYVDATNATASYVLYKDTVSLPPNCDKLMKVALLDGSRRIEMTYRPQLFSSFEYYPRSSGTPLIYTVIERDTNRRAVMQVGPYAPDKAYQCEILYKKHVENNARSELDESRLPLIIQRALYWALLRDTAKSNQHLGAYDLMLDEQWANAQDGTAYYVMQEQRVRTVGVSTDDMRSLEL